MVEVEVGRVDLDSFWLLPTLNRQEYLAAVARHGFLHAVNDMRNAYTDVESAKAKPRPQQSAGRARFRAATHCMMKYAEL